MLILRLFCSAGYYPASGSLADPPSTSVLVAAVSWVQSTLLGTVATAAAVIAIASIGFMMLTGRINVRSGAAVVVGSFVLFGASTIAIGLQFALSASETAQSPPVPVAPAPFVSAPSDAASAAQSAYDPYAGASVPDQ